MQGVEKSSAVTDEIDDGSSEKPKAVEQTSEDAEESKKESEDKQPEQALA